jgi:hypothetical protein
MLKPWQREKMTSRDSVFIESQYVKITILPKSSNLEVKFYIAPSREKLEFSKGIKVSRENHCTYSFPP